MILLTFTVITLSICYA